MDSLKIEYKSYVEEKDLTETARGHSLVTINVRSLEKNSERIKNFIETVKPTVLCLQEIWQHSSTFSGYTLTQRVRKNRRGGGVGILVKKASSLRRSGEK